MLVSRPLALSCPSAGAQLGAEVEPSLAADPHRPGRLLGAWQQDRRRTGGARAIAIGASQDGGRSWRAQPLPQLTACSGGGWEIASDPVAVIDAGGGGHVASLVAGDGSAVVVSSSPDLVRWSAPATVDLAPAPGLDDKPALAADPAVPGRLYAAWSRYASSMGEPGGESGGGRLLFSRSEDGGATWSAPSTPYGDGRSEVSSAVLVPLAGGRLVLVFTEGSPLFDLDHPGGLVQVEFTRSADGGRNWTPPAVLATYPLGIVHLPGGAPVRAVNQLVAAAGAGARVYVAWFTTGASAGLGLARSDDAGGSWLTLPAPAASRDPGFLPVLAAAGEGVAVLSYRLAAGAGLEQGAEAVLATSADQGEHWVGQRLGPAFDLARAPLANVGAFLGDYQGLAALRGGGYGALVTLSRPAARDGDSDVFYFSAPSR